MLKVGNECLKSMDFAAFRPSVHAVLDSDFWDFSLILPDFKILIGLTTQVLN